MANRLQVFIPITDQSPFTNKEAIDVLKANPLATEVCDHGVIDFTLDTWPCIMQLLEEGPFWSLYVYINHSAIFEDDDEERRCMASIHNIVSTLGAKECWYTGELSLDYVYDMIGKGIMVFQNIMNHSVELSEVHTYNYKEHQYRPLFHDIIAE